MPGRPDLNSLTPVEPESASEIGVSETDSTANVALPPKSPQPSSSSETGVPPPPPRPKMERRVSKFTSNLNELRAAFPDADLGVCRGVLVAASNDLEAAFSGMLAVSDPSIRPPVSNRAHSAAQIEQDARIARRLAGGNANTSRRPGRPQQLPSESEQYQTRQNSQTSFNDQESDFQRGFNETKQAVSSFWGSLKQKIANEIGDDDDMSELDYATGRRSGQYASQPWFSRDNGYHDESETRTAPYSPSSSNFPPLPPRGRRGVNEPRSVNVFGDDITSKDAVKRAVNPEPDAFFIGESDEDLGSIDGERSGRSDRFAETERPNSKTSSKTDLSTKGDDIATLRKNASNLTSPVDKEVKLESKLESKLENLKPISTASTVGTTNSAVSTPATPTVSNTASTAVSGTPKESAGKPELVVDTDLDEGENHITIEDDDDEVNEEQEENAKKDELEKKDEKELSETPIKDAIEKL